MYCVHCIHIRIRNKTAGVLKQAAPHWSDGERIQQRRWAEFGADAKRLPFLFGTAHRVHGLAASGCRCVAQSSPSRPSWQTCVEQQQQQQKTLEHSKTKKQTNKTLQILTRNSAFVKF